MLACAVLAPASFTVGKSDAVALGRMYALAIASPIPASSTLPDLHAIIHIRGWHFVAMPISKLSLQAHWGSGVVFNKMQVVKK